MLIYHLTPKFTSHIVQIWLIMMKRCTVEYSNFARQYGNIFSKTLSLLLASSSVHCWKQQWKNYWTFSTCAWRVFLHSVMQLWSLYLFVCLFVFSCSSVACNAYCSGLLLAAGAC